MELLITLTLFSAIMGFLMNTFFQFQRQSERMESMLKLRQEARILERIIRNDVQRAIYLDAFMADPLKEFDGRKSGIYGLDEMIGEKEADKIYLHVRNTSKFQRTLKAEEDPELHEVGYYLEDSIENELLFKRREEFYLDSDITQGEREIVHTLSRHVERFDIKYYRGQSTETVDEWDSSEFERSKKQEDKIPAGVLIKLELVGNDGEISNTEFQVNLRPHMGNDIVWR